MSGVHLTVTVSKVVKETSCMGEESFIAMEEQGERLSTTLVVCSFPRITLIPE